MATGHQRRRSLLVDVAITVVDSGGGARIVAVAGASCAIGRVD